MLATEVVANLDQLLDLQPVLAFTASRRTGHIAPVQGPHVRCLLFLGTERPHDTEVVVGVFFGRLGLCREVQEVSATVGIVREEVIRNDRMEPRIGPMETGGVYILATPLECIEGVRNQREEGRGTRAVLSISQNSYEREQTCASKLPAQEPAVTLTR